MGIKWCLRLNTKICMWYKLAHAQYKGMKIVIPVVLWHSLMRTWQMKGIQKFFQSGVRCWMLRHRRTLWLGLLEKTKLGKLRRAPKAWAQKFKGFKKRNALKMCLHHHPTWIRAWIDNSRCWKTRLHYFFSFHTDDVIDYGSHMYSGLVLSKMDWVSCVSLTYWVDIFSICFMDR